MQACHDADRVNDSLKQRTTYAPWIIMEAFKNNKLVNLEILINHVLEWLISRRILGGLWEILTRNLWLCFLPGEWTTQWTTKKMWQIWAGVLWLLFVSHIAFYEREYRKTRAEHRAGIHPRFCSDLPSSRQRTYVRGLRQLIVRLLRDSRNSAYLYSANKSISEPRTTPWVAVPRKSNVSSTE